MRARKRQILIPWLMLLSGIVGMGLWLALNILCLDQRRLLPAMHPWMLALGLLTVSALGLALYAALSLKAMEGYPENFPSSWGAFLGHLLAAVGILLTILESGSDARGRLELIWRVLALSSVPCLAAAGWLRLRGKKPFFLLHLCPAIFLVMHTIGQYQHWSSDPQLLNYLFSLLGIVSMVLFVFYHSSFDVGFPWRRRLTFFGLASIFLGLVALPGCGYPWLSLGIVLWAMMDLPVIGYKAEVPGE